MTRRLYTRARIKYNVKSLFKYDLINHIYIDIGNSYCDVKNLAKSTLAPFTITFLHDYNCCKFLISRA